MIATLMLNLTHTAIIHLTIDAELSSDYGSINTVEEVYADVLDDQYAVQNHREAFYRMYLPLYHKVKAGTNLINDAKYEELVKLLSNPLPTGASIGGLVPYGEG